MEQMSVIVEMDEEEDFVHSEASTYPIASLISDIGGAAGLFLGISVLGSGRNASLKIYTFPSLPNGKIKFVSET